MKKRKTLTVKPTTPNPACICEATSGMWEIHAAATLQGGLPGREDVQNEQSFSSNSRSEVAHPTESTMDRPLSPLNLVNPENGHRSGRPIVLASKSTAFREVRSEALPWSESTETPTARRSWILPRAPVSSVRWIHQTVFRATVENHGVGEDSHVLVIQRKDQIARNSHSSSHKFKPLLFFYSNNFFMTGSKFEAVEE